MSFYYLPVLTLFRMHARTRPHPESTAAHSSVHQYRPDIDGMRTVAVFMVVLFHAWPNWLQGGFVGVDIFFVISGFLITSIIIDDLEKQRFSILTFYSRRVRRIFPALILVMGATLLFGWVVLMRTEFSQLGKHIASGTAFISNLTLWSEAGYFDNNSTTKPLLHLWSLGVEEQFYIVWPVLMWGVYRLRVPFLKAAVLLFVASFGYSLFATFNLPTEGYFSPSTRFWELMCGGICAYLKRYHLEHLAGWTQSFSIIGCALLVLSVVMITEQTPFPGWWAAAPVLGTSLLILAGSNAWFNRRVLSQPVAVKLGQISYPFYLWHWPLLSFGYIVIGQKPSAPIKAVLIVAALALAALTYVLIEQPLKKVARRRVLIGSLCVLMAALGLVGVAVMTGALGPRLQSHGADRYLDALNDVEFPSSAMTPLTYQGVNFQRVAGKGNGTTVLLGDSVMEQYGAYVTNFLRQQPQQRHAVIFATAGGCPPIEGAVRLPQIKFPKCAQTVTAAHALARSGEVDTVVVGAAWYGYFNPSYTELTIGGKHFPAPDAQELAYQALQASLSKFVAAGKRVFLVLSPPAGREFDPRSMIEGSRFGQIRPRASLPPFDAQAFLTRHAAAHARLVRIAETSGVTVIDPLPALCPGMQCPVVDATGEPVYTDTVHMRPAFSLQGARYLAPALTARPPAKE